MQEKYDRLCREYAEASALASQLLADFKADAGYPAREKFERRTSVNPTEYEPYADDADQYRLEREHEAKVRQLEIRLCTLRTRIINRGGTEPGVRRERELHLLHRQEDRMVWLSWLTEKISLLEFLLEDENGRDLDRGAARQMIRDLDAEILRVKNLGEEELLADRDSLRADERLWQTPYLPFD